LALFILHPSAIRLSSAGTLDECIGLVEGAHGVAVAAVIGVMDFGFLAVSALDISPGAEGETPSILKQMSMSLEEDGLCGGGSTRSPRSSRNARMIRGHNPVPLRTATRMMRTISSCMGLMPGNL